MFPFYHLSLKTKKPYNPKYVAKLLRIWASTYSLWEANRTAPKIWYLRRIVDFLGFCPIDPNNTAGWRLARARQYLGLSQKRMARMIGIDPNIIWRLERETWEGREEYLGPS
jgi:transcriptional regulator with XRE-family HTH domain